MVADERQFLLTTAWMFMRHGRGARAVGLCEALVEENPRDGVAAAALAQLLLEDGEAKRALAVLRAAEYPPELEHAEAVLETRALAMLGRHGEAGARWRRYLEVRKGAGRQWVGSAGES